MSTKQKILEISLQLFMQAGFENTYMDDIADRAGVTKPAIYYHFKNKQSLFEASASMFLEKMTQMMKPEDQVIPPLEELLITIFGSLPKWFAQYQQMSGADDHASLLRSQVFIYDAMTRIPNFRSAISTLYRNSALLLQQACEEANNRGEIRSEVDIPTIGILINSMIEGLLLMSMIDPQIDLGELGHKSAATIWQMLKV